MKTYRIIAKVEERYQVEAETMKEALEKRKNPYAVIQLSAKAKVIKETH